MKILLIEDDPHTAAFLVATLSAHHYAVDLIADGAAGLELATQWEYDLILLDVLLPTLNGVEVCRRLRGQGCQTPILMLTVKNSNEDIIAGLDAGADDYVAKSSDASQLLARVRALMRRSGSVSASPILTWGNLHFDPASAQVCYNHEPIALRPKEYMLLELFLRHPQRIFSRSAVIDHLWSMEETPVEGSVTNLIKDLRHRLKLGGIDTDMIETVYGLGYRLRAALVEEKTPTKSDAESKDHDIAPPPVLARNWDEDWNARSQQGITAIQQITEQFQRSLEQRIAQLETIARSLQSGTITMPQQQTATTDLHKLAGGLGTFGYIKASAIAQTMERLLEKDLSQEPRLINQFVHLLEELKHSLAKPPINAPIV
jgi:DNA-binding response OmpR family regulator/HPt (histidine-containing phosphotransfer) domain-containing protein